MNQIKVLLTFLFTVIFIHANAQIEHEFQAVRLPSFFNASVTSPDYLINSEKRTFSTALQQEVIRDIFTYPNPVASILNIKFNIEGNATVSIDLIDMIGNAVQTWYVPESGSDYALQLPFDDVVKGIYFIKINAGSQSVVRKIIVKK